MSTRIHQATSSLRRNDVGGIDAKLAFLAIAVPASVIAASALASAVDLRLALAGAALVIGWTQLVGL